MTPGEERACPVCGATAGEPLRHQTFVLPDGHPLSAGYTVVTCAECGASYATPLPAQSAYDRFYRDASKYADAATGTGSGAQAWDDGRLEDTARHLATLVPDREAHVVDVGCGAGGLLRWFAKLGYTTLTGIDPAEACATATGAIPGVRGVVGSLFALPKDMPRAGLVVLAHVLEHVRDVSAAVAGLKAITSPGGRVYAEVPDASRYADFIVAPFLDFNTEHINHFSVATLQRAFTSGGWTIVASGTKDIASSPRTRYPCAWVLAELGSPAVRAAAPTADRALRAALLRYVSASQALLARVTTRLEAIARGHSEVIVWGTGQTTAILLAETPLGRMRIRAFTDSNPMHHGRTIAGVPVVAPDALRATPELPIVIGSLLHGAEIAESIAARGLVNPVLRLDPVAS